MPEITKRHVQMRSTVAVGIDDDGETLYQDQQVDDFVRPDFLDVYVADAQKRWQLVKVFDEPDAGPGGYHGQTHVPAHFDHPLAGQTFAATTPEEA
jgi:hypothetical protein